MISLAIETLKRARKTMRV